MTHTHQIYISVGSNIDRDAHIRAGLSAMAESFSELSLSTVYESEAVGFEGSHFLNLVVGATTEDSIEQVCQRLKQIEDDNGRIRGDKKFAPRTLDLDLLLYDQVECQKPVVLPRVEILHNAFVLLPLAELAPNGIHPQAGQTFAQLWDVFDKSSQRLWPVNFEWSDSSS